MTTMTEEDIANAAQVEFGEITEDGAMSVTVRNMPPRLFPTEALREVQGMMFIRDAIDMRVKKISEPYPSLKGLSPEEILEKFRRDFKLEYKGIGFGDRKDFMGEVGKDGNG